MRARAIDAVKSLLSSVQPEEMRKGLSKAREAMRDAPPAEAKVLFEIIATLFYLDPFDRPDLAPVLDDAITTVAGFGPRMVPALLAELDAGDLKAQIAVAHAMGRMGPAVVAPLIAAYHATMDLDRRSFILYALGKVGSPEVANAASLAIDGALSPDRELRDTATRAIGKFAEAIPPGRLTELTRRSIVAALRTNLANPSPAIRAKSVRSLGKLGRYGHLTADERAEVAATCRRLSGKGEERDADRAFVVRKEAEEALRHLGVEPTVHALAGKS